MQVCEAFGCLPSEAAAELERDAQMVLDALDLLAYRDAFVRNERIEAQCKSLTDRTRARAGDRLIAEVLENSVPRGGDDDGEPGDGDD